MLNEKTQKNDITAKEHDLSMRDIFAKTGHETLRALLLAQLAQVGSTIYLPIGISASIKSLNGAKLLVFRTPGDSKLN